MSAPADRAAWQVCGQECRAARPGRAGYALSPASASHTARVMRFAFGLARSRPRKLLTVVTKSNAQRHGMVLWDEIAAEVAREFPDVAWDKMLVDAMTARMTLKPATLDTIVATNLHADVLSDLAAALAGSLGVAPTANLNPERRFPSMFEPIHGSAFDIVGKGIANPIGTFWSSVMLLEHLGETAAAARLMRAIERVTGHPVSVAAALVRDPARHPDAPPGLLTTEFARVRDDPAVSVVAEVMGGVDPTREYVLELLRAGKSVVSANKQLLSRHGQELFAEAERCSVQLRFEASASA